RRTFLAGTALGALAIAGCNVVPGLGGKAKMTIWTDATFAPASDDYQSKVIDDWSKEKGVEVEVTRDPGDQVDKKLQAAVESKQVPDISQMDDGRLLKYQPSGLVLDVSDLYQEQ